MRGYFYKISKSPKLLYYLKITAGWKLSSVVMSRSWGRGVFCSVEAGQGSNFTPEVQLSSSQPKYWWNERSYGIFSLEYFQLGRKGRISNWCKHFHCLIIRFLLVNLFFGTYITYVKHPESLKGYITIFRARIVHVRFSLNKEQH